LALLGRSAKDGGRSSCEGTSNFDHTSDRNLVVTAIRAISGEDEVWFAKGAVPIFLAVDHVDVARARRFDAQAHLLPFSQFRFRFDSLRRVGDFLHALLYQQARPDNIASLLRLQQPERDANHGVGGHLLGRDLRRGFAVITFGARGLRLWRLIGGLRLPDVFVVQRIPQLPAFILNWLCCYREQSGEAEQQAASHNTAPPFDEFVCHFNLLRTWRKLSSIGFYTNSSGGSTTG
jgi:hypothetical protein